MTDDDRLIWRPQRVRVVPTRTYENPWSREGSRARDERAFLARLSADRPEEDEDYPVLAPRRPTRSFTNWDHSLLLDGIDRSVLPRDSEQKSWDEANAARERALKERHEVARYRAWLTLPWQYGLDDLSVFDEADAFDQQIERVQGHWYSPRRFHKLGGRDIRADYVAWYLQHGEITSTTRIRQTCRARHCISPHHHEELT